MNTQSVSQHDLLFQMLRMRRFEEKCAEMYTKTKIRGFLHLYIGEEAVATGVMHALEKDDYVLSTYREHGHALARGIDANAIMAEMYGKKEGCCLGRGGSMHIFDTRQKFFGGNAIVSGHLPLAVGMALAQKKLRSNAITCCFFGEGAMAEGEFHESMNLAALHQVPLLFVCENNRYAMGTALQYTHAMQQLEKKADAYSMQSAAADGMDVLAIVKAANTAVDYVRTESKPYLLVCNTYRFRAHSMFDAELYREKSETEEWKKRDPIDTLTKSMKAENLISENEIQEMENRIAIEIQHAVDYAENGTWEAPEDLTKYVYSEKNQINTLQNQNAIFHKK